MKKWSGLILILVSLFFVFSNLNERKKNQIEQVQEKTIPKYEYGIYVDTFINPNL